MNFQNILTGIEKIDPEVYDILRFAGGCLVIFIAAGLAPNKCACHAYVFVYLVSTGSEFMAFYKDLNDIELVKMLREGAGISNPAFEELFNRFWQKLFTVALHRLGSHDEAEEVVQEVFYNLWKRRTSLQLTASPATYLATAVKYEIINRLAKIERGAQYIRYAGDNGLSADDSTQEWLRFEELRTAIARSVKALPEKCRLVYTLSREKGYSEKQIASELNISVKTVEAHLSKAIKTLRTSLRHIFFFYF